MFYSLEGTWNVRLAGDVSAKVRLPGTLDENQIGEKDHATGSCHPEADLGNSETAIEPDAIIATRFTRKHTYEGKAEFTRRICYQPPEGKRVFLEAERARCLELFVDGKLIPDFVEPSLSTPHIFELTGRLTGDNELMLSSDNSYPKMPHDSIVFSSAATDETQTNWNGILGLLGLRVEEEVFISSIRCYPKKDEVTVKVEIEAAVPYTGKLIVSSEALADQAVKEVDIVAGRAEIVFPDLKITEGIKYWDEQEGNLYEMTARLERYGEKTISFGVREFKDNGFGRLALNGRTIFLRSEANCAEFPETGHPPMTVEEWLTILQRYQSYGINCMRFHSHCPPEAAFTAADQLGMLMQPELSHWNPEDAFESEESFSYYQTELSQVILRLANHPSFVMLTFGNELWPKELGHTRASSMLAKAHALDSTRLYAIGSNVYFGLRGCDAESDFYTSCGYYEYPLRGTSAGAPEPGDDTDKRASIPIQGHINNQYPNAMTNYDRTMDKLRETYQKPVFSFEVGQFEILPDFDELREFKGISKPENLRLIQKKVEGNELNDVWKQYVEATGELSRIGYREEIEAAMRTKELSGISLLGLQDFPGQGTALVGMLNSHLQPKPFAFSKAEAFHAFFRDQLPLVYLPKYTYETSEILKAEVKVANYGKRELRGALSYELSGEGICSRGVLPEAVCPVGVLTTAGTIEISLREIRKNCRMNLQVTIEGTTNCYPVWVYLPVTPLCPKNVYEARSLDEKSVEVLQAGGTVYLSPDATKEALPNSIKGQFTTDFWSVGTFPKQEGGMGQLIDKAHPVFTKFPTESHTNWQWWLMAGQRAVIIPKQYKAIITEMDSYAYMRPMAQLIEWNCGGGKVLLSTMGLHQLQGYPEARALLAAIYDYLGSGRCEPKQEITIKELAAMVRPVEERQENDKHLASGVPIF